MGFLPNGKGELLIQSNTFDGDTSIVDSSGNDVVLEINSGWHTTAMSKFGSTSIYCPCNIQFQGSSVSQNAVDFWFYPTASSNEILIEWYNGSQGYYSYITLQKRDDNKIKLYYGGVISGISATLLFEFPYEFQLNAWNHVYFGFDNDWYFGLNGIVLYITRVVMTLGNVWTRIYGCTGYIDEVRFSNYDLVESNYETYENFYPIYLYEVSGKVKEQLNFVSRKVRLYNRDSGELISETTSDSNGDFSITLASQNECYAVCLDDDSGVEYNALIYDRIIPNISED